MALQQVVRKFFGQALDLLSEDTRITRQRSDDMAKRMIESIEIEMGSGNVFADLGLADQAVGDAI